MLSRLSIAKKIFGLAVLLLCLTVVLACFLLWHVTLLQGELQVITQRKIPLIVSLSRLNEYGLRRRLAFERWFGALDAARPNEEVIKEAQANYTEFTERLNQEFVTAKMLLDFKAPEDRDRETLTKGLAILPQIEAAVHIISTR